MTFIPGQGTTFKWGTTELHVTSLAISAGTEGDIDITSMSSKVREDKDNPDAKYVYRDTDSFCVGESLAEFQIEFFAGTQINGSTVLDLVGKKRDLSVQLPKDDSGTFAPGFSLLQTALLTQMSLAVNTGEFVRGSATFRLTND